MSFLPENKEIRLQCFLNAMSNWSVTGYVQFTPRVDEWLKNEIASHSISEIRKLLWEFVNQTGLVDERKEIRPEYVSFEYWYRIRIPIDSRVVFFEILLDVEDSNDRDGSTITVVSVHYE